MPKVTATDFIDVPVDQAFDYVKMGAENGPVWIPQILSHSNISSVIPHVGQTWDWAFNMMGVTLNGHSETIELEENKRGAFRTTGDVDSTWTFLYEPENDGTRFTVEIEYEIPGGVLGKFANRAFIEHMNQKYADDGVANLKLILES